MENITPDQEDKKNCIQVISDEKLENLMNGLDIKSDDPQLDYSKILYYSLVFNDDEYLKILSLVFDNTVEFHGIFGIYNYTEDKEIVVLREKPIKKLNSNETLITTPDIVNVLPDIVNVSPDIVNVSSYFSKQIEKLTPKDNFAIKLSNSNSNMGTLYKLNDKFHTTMLYLGGKKDPRALELEPIVGSEIVVSIVSVGISEKFIVCGIEFESKTIPYYGNPIQHITIGLKKTESNKFKLFPKDSPTAFVEGVKIILDKPIKITGVLKKETK